MTLPHCVHSWPASLQAELHQAFATLDPLTSAELAWFILPFSTGNLTVRHDAVALLRQHQRAQAWDAVEEAMLAKFRVLDPPANHPAARFAGRSFILAVLISDLTADLTPTLRHNWEEGLRIVSWARQADPAVVEVALCLAREWSGTVDALLRAATACS